MLPVNNRAPLFPATTSSTMTGVSSTTAKNRSPQEYLALWREWETNATPGGGELRDVAVIRLRDCLQQRCARLDLSELNLASLPPLPPHIALLNISDNQLTALTALPQGLTLLKVSYNLLTELPPLPPRLETLYAIGNRLVSLPVLPDTLETLYLNSNRLTALPPLPNALITLYTARNKITELPPSLPQYLQWIDLSDNQLRRLPESITSLRHCCFVQVSNNPFSRRTIQSLLDINTAPDYCGPRIHFSMHDGSDVDGPVRPLTQAVADWLAPENKEAEKAWSAIATEENTPPFSAFLDRLEETINAKKSPLFKQQVAAWLTLLPASAKLRQMIFAIALEATASCEDRVSLTWNTMQIATLAHDGENGKYDHKLPELITLGREMFRLTQLEQISREKMKTLCFVDETGVCLGFQVRLRDALALTSVVNEMRFFAVSGVSASDLETAEISVKTAENHEFPAWFSQWAPWHSVLARIEPDAWQRAIERKYQALENDYPSRVNAELAAASLKDHPDAEPIIGKKTMDDINKEIFMDLTRQVMMNRNLAPLMAWQWKI